MTLKFCCQNELTACNSKILSNLLRFLETLVFFFLNLLCEFAKLCAMRASVVVDVPKARQLLIFPRQRPNKRTNVQYGVTMFQLAVPTCQKACQFFKYFSSETLSEISILYYYTKNSTLYWISQFYISYVCIVHKNFNCTSFLKLRVISRKSVCNFSFLFFLLFSQKWKYRKTWLLYITSNKGFLEAETTK